MLLCMHKMESLASPCLTRAGNLVRGQQLYKKTANAKLQQERICRGTLWDPNLYEHFELHFFMTGEAILKLLH